MQLLGLSLTEARQDLFQRLAVFAGGCTMEAIAALAAPSVGLDGTLVAALQSLVDTSLLHKTSSSDGEPRFATLETIRQLAGRVEKAQAENTPKSDLLAGLKQWADTLQPAGKADNPDNPTHPPQPQPGPNPGPNPNPGQYP